jgi:hypothetical protein
MDTLGKLEIALEEQNRSAKEFKLAFENVKELYEKYEKAYCEVLVTLTTLLQDFTKLVSKEGESAAVGQKVADSHSLEIKNGNY